MKKKICFVISFFTINLALFAQMDSTFTWVVNPKFEIADPFIEDLSRIKYHGKWGFINTKGEMIVSPLYDSVINFSDGLAAFLWQNGKWGFVDKTGKNVIYPQFDYVGSFSDGTAAALKENSWGMIDTKGYFVGNPEIDNNGDLQTLLAISQKDQPPIKMSAALADQFGLDYVGRYFYTLAAASKDGGWGFINQQGDIVIDLKYEAVGDFSNRVVRVMQNGKWGFLDQEGKVIIPFIFEEVTDFQNELAFVLVDQKWGLIRKNQATENTSSNKENRKKK